MLGSGYILHGIYILIAYHICLVPREGRQKRQLCVVVFILYVCNRLYVTSLSCEGLKCAYHK